MDGFLRVITSALRVVTSTLRIDTYTLHILTYCLRFGEIVEIVGITAICFSHMPCCLSGCQLSNDDTLRFAGFIYLLAKNRKDS